jgi:NAD(P)H-hydrate epimerase
MAHAGSKAMASVYVLTRDASRELDRLALEEFGIPTIVLMENAARHAADIALDGLEGIDAPHVIIAAGPGNNGGDGLALARHLHNAGCTVAILQAQDPKPGSDAVVHLGICQKMGIRVERPPARGLSMWLDDAIARLGSCDLIVDALVGTGLSRPLEGVFASLARAITLRGHGGCPVLSLDCPSGMDVETGEAMTVPGGERAKDAGGEGVVRASVTITFCGLRPGFLTLAAQAYLGEVVVADVGAPRELLDRLGTRIASPPGMSGEGGRGPKAGAVRARK